MKFLSVCSGIEAASVAWAPLGWSAVAFSEIEPFPCALLKHHYPDTPNWGDMNNFKDWPDVSIDLLCGGTPCQSFSVAGLRKGLDDPRGNLMLTFGAIAAKYRPKWLVWENVPGVLSSNSGRDFGAFLGMLGQLGYGFAYRVLDAQYFGVAQRRRRVFVVGCLGDWHRAAAVLFDRESLSGHPAPSREAGQGFAAVAAQGVAIRGREGGGTAELTGPIATALRASQGGGDKPHVLSVAHSLRGEGFDASDDGTGRGTPLVPVMIGCDNYNGRLTGDIATTLSTQSGDGVSSGPSVMVAYTTKLHNTTNNQAGKVYEEYTTALDRSSPPPAVLTAMQVRRLTPEECEALQGFKRGYTAIPHRGKPAADGPRYKALGNSWATPNVQWIGRRIEAVQKLKTIRQMEIAA